MKRKSIVVADSLEQAGPRDLIQMDRKGRARSRGYRLAAQGAYFGTLGTLLSIEAYLGHLLWGIPGLSIAAGLGGLVAWVLTNAFRIRRGVALTADRKLDAAEAALVPVTKRWFIPRRVRARAFAALAMVASLQKDHEAALAHLRTALRYFRNSSNAHATLVRYAEAQVLAKLGRLDEAREVFAPLAEIPSGEVLRLRHHATALYLAFKEGRHDLSDDELHDWASFSLGITVSAPVLGLLAWAFIENGDEDMASLLSSEARDRPGDLLRLRTPEVADWLDAHDAGETPVRVAALEEAEEELEVGARPSREKKRARIR